MGEVGVSEDGQVSGGSQEAPSHPGSRLTAQREAGRSSMESAHSHYMHMGAHHSHTSIPTRLHTQPRPSGQDASPSGASSVPWWSFGPLQGRWEAKPRWGLGRTAGGALPLNERARGGSRTLHASSSQAPESLDLRHFPEISGLLCLDLSLYLQKAPVDS